MQRTGKLHRLRSWLPWLLLLPWCVHPFTPVFAGQSDLPPPRELPTGESTPTDGLSLDQAIEQLLQRNFDLRIKFQEIPKSRADVLSAGLRNNPSAFFSADNIPYGNYSEQRPGETGYELTLVQPVDVNNKRRRRIQLAERARHLTEALYQEAVRQEIDKLYTAYLDVLEAVIRVQADRTNAALQGERVKWIEGPVRQGLRPRVELTQAQVDQGRVEAELHKAEAHLLQSRRDLAVLLVAPPDRADTLNVCDPLRDTAPLPPCVDDLVRLALHLRPDLAAYRLDVHRAQAQVDRTRAERFEDVLVFYSPYQIQVFSNQPAQAAPGWEAGALLVLPVFDRKQGDILRANVEVKQSQIEVQGIEQQVSNEVRQAATDYVVSRQSVQHYERDILPGARRVLEEQQRLFASGREGIDTWLTARKDYNDVLRQYREVLLRHRRAMLKLNTAVGQRLLP